jgi:mannose-6-phosphate isomerase
MNNDNVLFLTAPLKERIWGNSYFKDELHLTSSEEKIGEMWSCSGLEESPSFIKEGKYQGRSLAELYKEEPGLFNSQVSYFPILIKLLSTESDLSIQVHPDDKMAQHMGLKCGKSECWLILDAKKDARIVYGSKVKTREDLEKHALKKDYDGILSYRSVKKGDFFPIKAGTIHALGAGLRVLEIQQSADITLRFYDYDRLDKNGLKRPLQTEEAIKAAHFELPSSTKSNLFAEEGRIELGQYADFEAELVNFKDSYEVEANERFAIVSLCFGNVKAEGRSLVPGESFIITVGSKARLEGAGSFAVSRPIR